MHDKAQSPLTQGWAGATAQPGISFGLAAQIEH